MSFCFSFYTSLRYLHSFPTRRSSDLAGPLFVVSMARTLFVPSRTGPTPGMKLVAWSRTTSSLGWVDRKSTRLNSSHTVISYAVFCLKKKKHIGITNRGVLRVLASAYV